MPSMSDLKAYEIVQNDDDTYAALFARSGTVAHLNGVPQLGLRLDQADDVADHLEALDRMAAARSTGRLDS